MAKVMIASIQPQADQRMVQIVDHHHERFRSVAERSTTHSLVMDPDSADLILLYASFTLFRSHIDPSRASLRKHPFRREYFGKTFAYDIDDDPLPIFPGLYVSLTRRSFDSTRQRAAPYIHYFGNRLLTPRDSAEAAVSLFSFIGAPTHPLRKAIFQLDHPRTRLLSTSAKWPAGSAEREAFKVQYADSIHASKFVLCPRGRGPASVRLFEVMQAGRIPVIISDDWIPPAGPEWEGCSVRVREDQIKTIPSLLEKLEPQAGQMATQARSIWEDWFSEDSVFDRMIESCAQIGYHRSGFNTWERLRLVPHLCRSKIVHGFLGRALRMTRKTMVGPFTKVKSDQC